MKTIFNLQCFAACLVFSVLHSCHTEDTLQDQRHDHKYHSQLIEAGHTVSQFSDSIFVSNDVIKLTGSISIMTNDFNFIPHDGIPISSFCTDIVNLNISIQVNGQAEFISSQKIQPFKCDWINTISIPVFDKEGDSDVFLQYSLPEYQGNQKIDLIHRINLAINNRNEIRISKMQFL